MSYNGIDIKFFPHKGMSLYPGQYVILDRVHILDNRVCILDIIWFNYKYEYNYNNLIKKKGPFLRYWWYALELKVFTNPNLFLRPVLMMLLDQVNLLNF